ncbi:MAG TPA: hypothetical protein VN441_04285 [Syntrophomonas sp.]|nr:hypothetical protein [Syntrophomonas sp.]
MNKYGTINRLLTREQYHWLDFDIPAGTKVMQYRGPTYGCIKHGVAIVMEDEAGNFEIPFYEVPRNSVDWRE